MDQSALSKLLSASGLADLRYLPTTGSTNADALQWLESGAPDFSLVIADEQTAGRGRFDRRWITTPGAALAFTLILRPVPAEMPYIHLFSPLAGIGVSAALEKSLQLYPQIKWPNDVLIDRQKICGILTETSWNGDKLVGVVIGIGVNITPLSLPPAEMLSYPAACLEDKAGKTLDRWAILAEILHQLKGWRKKIAQDDFFEYWQNHLAFAGEEVEIRGAMGAEVEGRLVGIDPSGELVIETDNGEVSIQVGDVHLRLRQP